MEDRADAAELVKCLESGDLEVVAKFTQVIHENLYAAKDSTLLNSLVDCYVGSKSENLLSIIVGINESHCQYLFEKMNDLLRRGMQTEISLLFAAIIRKQPSWLYKVVGCQFFTNYLKTLRGDQDVVFLMSGAVIISMLLPCVPSLVAQYLGDILDIFVKMASFLVHKPAALPDILILHLQIGVYILFHRLYAMYPNNFLSYMRSYYGSKGNDPVFRQVIQPMSQFVKLHTGLILDTSKSETEKTKWKTSQPHDIFAECQKISLDPLDAVKEATYTVLSETSFGIQGLAARKEVVVSTAVTSVANDNLSSVNSECKISATEPFHHDDNGKLLHTHDSTSYLSKQELSLFWSPSYSCGLSTPPSSRTLSPANSAQDITSLNEFCQRPMTPSADVEREGANEQQESRTSPADTARRRSGGELKKSHQKSHKSPKLSVKSKSEESMENRGSKTHREESKVELSPELMKYNVDRSRTSPSKKKLDQLQGHIGNIKTKLSPKLSRSDKMVTKQTQSAPSTPALAQKDSFTFQPVQDHGYLQNETLTPDYHNRSLPQSGTAFTPYQSDKRTMPGSHNVSRSESPVNKSNASISLLRVVKDLHQEALSKSHGPASQEHDVIEHFEKLKVKSPLELLDEFIECGSSMHTHQLSRIPITSQIDTDWTYFGGSTPADELSILKTQLNLFEVQLQYQRYKCDQHVLRNRRLVGKVHKAQAIEDEIDTLRNQISLLESELREVKIALKHKDELVRRHQDTHQVSEKRISGTLQEFQAENEVLRCKLDELVDKLASKECQLTSTASELKSVQHELFETKSELDHIKPKLEINNAVQAKADNLAKALVTFHDKYDKVKRQVQLFEKSHVGGEESLMELEALKIEVREQKVEREHLLSSLDAAKVRIADLEALLAKKESLIREQKTKTEEIYQKHEEEKKVLGERYKCLKKAIQSMESYILYLFAKLEENGRDVRGHSYGGGHRRSERHERSGHDDNHSHRSHHGERRTEIDLHTKLSHKDNVGQKRRADDEPVAGSKAKVEAEHDKQSLSSGESRSILLLDDGSESRTDNDSISSELKNDKRLDQERTHSLHVDNERQVDDSGIERSGAL